MTGTVKERRTEAARLRGLGYTAREIAEMLGVRRSTVYSYLDDPTGAKLRARKDSYRGTCERCGVRTDGSRGPGKAPPVCHTCLGRERHEKRFWTPEQIIDTICDFADRNGGIPPTAQEAGRSSLQHTAQREFGSWANALRAAGYEPHNNHPGRIGTGAEILETAELHAKGIPATVLAKRYGITPGAVYRRVRTVRSRGTRYYEQKEAA